MDEQTDSLGVEIHIHIEFISFQLCQNTRWRKKCQELEESSFVMMQKINSLLLHGTFLLYIQTLQIDSLFSLQEMKEKNLVEF